jgi:hypothetical protein
LPKGKAPTYKVGAFCLYVKEFFDFQYLSM